MKHPGWIAVTLLGVSFAENAGAQPTAGFPPAPAPGATPATPSAPPPPPGPPPPPPPASPPPPAPPPPEPVPPAYPQTSPPPPVNRSRASFPSDGAAPGPVEPGAPAAPPPPAVPPPPVAPYLPPIQPYQQVLVPYQRPADAWMPGYGEPEARPTYVYIRDPHGYRHDGFYFRVAWGAGMASDGVEADRALPDARGLIALPVPFNGDASGFAVATELAMGFTLGRGLVVGLGVYTATVPSPEASIDDPRTGKYEYRVSQQALISPVVDFYFFPKLGFHAQAGLGLATYIAGVADPVNLGPRAQAHTATGFGFMAGVGYEWWVSRVWSIGLIGRVVYGSTSGSDNRGVNWSHTTLVPAALLGATYH